MFERKKRKDCKHRLLERKKGKIADNACSKEKTKFVRVKKPKVKKDWNKRKMVMHNSRNIVEKHSSKRLHVPRGNQAQGVGEEKGMGGWSENGKEGGREGVARTNE